MRDPEKLDIKMIAPGLYMALNLIARSRFGVSIRELARKHPREAAEFISTLYPGMPKGLIDELIVSLQGSNAFKPT